jgi:hypothetical protein
METLIYTYKSPLYRILQTETNQKEWIIRSIESARNVGYENIELYTNDKTFSETLDINKVHFIDDDYQLWDSFKLWVLENRKDKNYLLIDNDVIINEKIPIDYSTDLFFDGIEIYNWNSVYEKEIEFLKSNKIFDKFEFWDYKKRGVFNVGILKINNTKLKNDYIFYWKNIYQVILPYLDKVNKTNITAIITQYLLTILCEDGKYSYKYFTQNGAWPFNNDYYNHYNGYLKLGKKTPI